MLKIKQFVNYRRGSISRNCGGCDHYTSKFQVMSCNGNPLQIEPRCKVIGLENGRMYRVSDKHVCDRFDNEQGLRRLLGDRAYKQFIEKGGNHETA